jgi:carboxyl-terminal processing protease
VKSKLDETFVDTREDKKEVTKDDIIFGAASGLVASYGDLHTVFFPPEDGKEFADDLSGEFSGIGVEISNQKGFLTVVSPLLGTPGFKAGLIPKDIIVKIDGKDSTHMSSSEAVKLIRGKEGEIVELTIARKGEVKPLDIKIKRAKIKIPVVKTFVKNNVFVAKFYSFTENSPQVFYNTIIPKFKRSGLKTMILDLRGNSGGFLRAGVFISGIFLPEGTDIVREDHQGRGEDKK